MIKKFILTLVFALAVFPFVVIFFGKTYELGYSRGDGKFYQFTRYAVPLFGYRLTSPSDVQLREFNGLDYLIQIGAIPADADFRDLETIHAHINGLKGVRGIYSMLIQSDFSLELTSGEIEWAKNNPALGKQVLVNANKEAMSGRPYVAAAYMHCFRELVSGKSLTLNEIVEKAEGEAR